MPSQPSANKRNVREHTNNREHSKRGSAAGSFRLLGFGAAALLIASLGGCAVESPVADFTDIPLEDDIVLKEVSFRNDRGETIKALYAAPERSTPGPAVVLMHGSGGLFDPPDPGEPSHEIGPQFREWAALLYSQGYAVLMPASFYSRGFYEWGDQPDSMDKEDRLIMRVYDAHGALAYACDRPEIDCERIAAVGFSDGASVSTLAVHTRLDEVEGMEKLTPVEERPNFQMVIPYYPGCGFYGLVKINTDDPDEFYEPSVPVYMQHGDDDKLLDDCETRLDQTDTLTDLLGLSQNPFHLFVYNAGHSFDNDPRGSSEESARDEARSLTFELLDEMR
ncbi:dienelactone hydrolase family protein [Haliangium ochraceum]|uniref:Dienelactone hydrolase n=1 Tax=Haliangium ochraceum (strain DSM 14365 / JCM 11303 / SMP-2) TaxID=502025 RepID=D0LJP0_HALO1|nr:dienelactone hydrolase family protein [Haliangium ochraceum]ACY16614.1 dienelactone hydrolase [Haliangium ochraceum DSM 14365]